MIKVSRDEIPVLGERMEGNVGREVREALVTSYDTIFGITATIGAAYGNSIFVDGVFDSYGNRAELGDWTICIDGDTRKSVHGSLLCEFVKAIISQSLEKVNKS